MLWWPFAIASTSYAYARGHWCTRLS
jgi:hypothetical protein